MVVFSSSAVFGMLMVVVVGELTFIILTNLCGDGSDLVEFEVFIIDFNSGDWLGLSCRRNSVRIGMS